MTTRREIIPPGMENIRERFHYAPGLLVGDTLHIAGQVGRDANLRVVEGTEAQMVQAFENVKKVLTAAGATFDDVVDMTTYHVAIDEHWPAFIEVKKRMLPRSAFPWTAIGVAALADPAFLLEVKATACRSR